MKLHTILLEMRSPDQLARLWIKQIMAFIKDKDRDTYKDFMNFPVPASIKHNYPKLNPLYVELFGSHTPGAYSQGMYHPRTKWGDPALISLRLIVPENPTGAELAKLQERIYQSLRHEIEHHQQVLRKAKDAGIVGDRDVPDITGCPPNLLKQVQHFLTPLEIEANVVTIVKYAKAHRISFEDAVRQFLTNALVARSPSPSDMDIAFEIIYPYFKQYAEKRFGIIQQVDHSQ